MNVSATQLRQNVYRLLDHVVNTGETLEVYRKGKRLVIQVEEVPSRLARLKAKPGVIQGDIETIDWLNEWKGHEDL